MNCKQSEKAMTIAIFGTLNKEDKIALKTHISQCRKCARKWEKTAPLRNRTHEDPVFPLPDPERSWSVISERLSKRRPRPLPIRNWHWVPIAAALLLVFAAGFFFGRRVFLTLPKELAFPLSDLSEASLESYADHLQPVLINFLNQKSVKSPDSVRRLERHIISDLLDRTRLLKSLIPEDGNSDLRNLLQDLEFILTAMDNLEVDDRDTARHLVGLIRDKQVSLRLHQLIRTQSTL